MKPATLRLLKYLAERHPLGVATTNALPDAVYSGPGHVGMATVRGLVKRGWATEDHAGIFYVTEAGINALKDLKA